MREDERQRAAKDFHDKVLHHFFNCLRRPSMFSKPRVRSADMVPTMTAGVKRYACGQARRRPPGGGHATISFREFPHTRPRGALAAPESRVMTIKGATVNIN
jgi:hypothetical protein